MRPIKKVTGISLGVYERFNVDGQILDTLCLYSTVFCKFQLDRSGKMVNLDIGAAPLTVRRSLVKAFEQVNSDLRISPSEIKKYQQKLLIIPVVLYYGMACELREIQLNEDKSTSFSKVMKDHLALNATTRSSNYAIEELFKKGGNNLAEMECILLSPISKGAHRY